VCGRTNRDGLFFTAFGVMEYHGHGLCFRAAFGVMWGSTHVITAVQRR
jgi:hypothetical protein